MRITSIHFSCLLAFLLQTVFILTAGCIKPIRYEPSQLAAFDAKYGNLRLQYDTEKGRQVAFYIPPVNYPDRPPRRISILYPGINSVALDWQRYIPYGQDPDTAYLLIDYPGRGLCEGSMRPEENYKNSEGALRMLREKFGTEELHAELNLLGHSFGTGSALQFAERVEVTNIVLVAPFNDLKTAVALQSWFLSVIMPSQIDNHQIIHELLESAKPPQITILHGTLDQTLPVTMGRQLAAINPKKIVFYEFADDDHMSILTTRRDLIFSQLNGKKDD